jgi:hypothetical protein
MRGGMTRLFCFAAVLGASMTACGARDLDLPAVDAHDPGKNDFASPAFDLGPACAYATLKGACTLVETGDPIQVQFQPDDPQAVQQTSMPTFADGPRGAAPACTAAAFDEVGDVVRCQVQIITRGACQPWQFSYPEVCP